MASMPTSGWNLFLCYVPDVAEGAHAFLLTYGPHIRSDWVLLTRLAFHDYHNPFAIVPELHSHSLVVNQPIEAERVLGLQVIGLGISAYSS